MKQCFLFLCFFLLIKLQGYSQGKTVYRNLVMEGGEIRGIAYGGALSKLQEQEILPEIKRIGGTSAGAIQAMLLALGYSPAEITSITYQTNIKQFADGRFIFIGGFSRMFNQFGWYRGEKFEKWLGRLVEQKTGNKDLTFAQLHKMAGQNGIRDLYVTGTNLTKQQTEILSYETYPEMKVRDAVRISMSIPLFFRAVAIDSEGKIVPVKKNMPPANIMVDGGIVANFPIKIFDYERYLIPEKTTDPNKPIFNPETLGLRLDRSEQIAYDRRQNGLAPYPISGFNEYMGAFYNMVLENLNRSSLNPEDWQRTISINTLKFSPKIRKLNASQKEQLLHSGEVAVEDFFKGNP